MYQNDVTDIHAHVLFGTPEAMDDGADSLEVSLAMLKLARAEGARTVFAAPHYGKENGYAPDAGLARERLDQTGGGFPSASLFVDGDECFQARQGAGPMRSFARTKEEAADALCARCSNYGRERMLFYACTAASVSVRPMRFLGAGR